MTIKNPYTQINQYFIIKENYNDPYIGAHSAYAIVATVNDTITSYIPDVFSDKAQAQDFVALCNEMALDPVHLADVVVDILF